MSSLGFSYGHLHVQQKRLKEKQKNTNDKKSKGQENSNTAKKIHPIVIASTQESSLDHQMKDVHFLAHK